MKYRRSARLARRNSILVNLLQSDRDFMRSGAEALADDKRDVGLEDAKRRYGIQP